MIEYFVAHANKIYGLFVEHFQIVSLSLIFSVIIASIITYLLLRYEKWVNSTVYILSLLYAVPSFAFFALLIPLTGLGKATAVLVLTVYSQYTLVRTFLSGIRQINPSIIEAAKGMGMTDDDILKKVKLPLSQKSIIAGIRLCATNIVAMTTIAATINAGGIGELIFDGLRTMSIIKILWGIILTIICSGVFYLIIGLFEVDKPNNM